MRMRAGRRQNDRTTRRHLSKTARGLRQVSSYRSVVLSFCRPVVLSSCCARQDDRTTRRHLIETARTTRRHYKCRSVVLLCARFTSSVVFSFCRSVVLSSCRLVVRANTKLQNFKMSLFRSVACAKTTERKDDI